MVVRYIRSRTPERRQGAGKFAFTVDVETYRNLTRTSWRWQ